MKKNFLKASVMICFTIIQTAIYGQTQKRPVLEIAHFTDVHIRTEYNALNRFTKTIQHLKKNYPKVDFVINTGDAVDNPNRSRMHLDSLWNLWQKASERFAPLPLYSCLGNHDPFYRNQDKDSSFYGKSYAVSHLGMPDRYYSFVKSNWLFVALDGNNPGGIDATQKEWLSQLLLENKAKLNVLIFLHEPLVSPGASYDGGYLENWEGIVDILMNHKEVKCVLSGHTHINDEAFLNGIHYYNGGSAAGYWWEKGPKGDGSYRGSKPGYGILKLYKNGDSEYEFIPMNNN